MCASVRCMTLLEFLRLERGLTKSATARLVRMLETQYSLVERGLEPPSANQAKRLSATFGYEAELLAIDVGSLVRAALSQPQTITAPTTERRSTRASSDLARFVEVPE